MKAKVHTLFSYTNSPNILLFLMAAPFLNRFVTHVHSSHISLSANSHVMNAIHCNMPLTPLVRLQACLHYQHGNGTAQPRTGHEDSEVEQRHSSTLSLTMALDAVHGKCHASAALLPGKRPSVHSTEGQAGPRACPQTIHSIASHYND